MYVAFLYRVCEISYYVNITDFLFDIFSSNKIKFFQASTV